MSEFYTLLHNTDLKGAMEVIDYEFGEYNLTALWAGKPLPSKVPDTVKIYVDDARKMRPDYLSNPMSWQIWSDRMVKLLRETCSNDIEIFDIALIDKKTNELVPGYKNINITRLIDSIDLDRSGVLYGEDGRISSVGDIVIDKRKVPSNVNIFRPSEWRFVVVVRKCVVEALIGQGLEGVAVLPA